MKAWVIYLTSLTATKSNGSKYSNGAGPTKVLALISARKSDSYIKKYVENIYYILTMNLEEQMKVSKYNSPSKPPKAISSSEYLVYCFKKPILIRGQRSDILDIEYENGVFWLEWRGLPYKRYAVNTETNLPEVIEEVVPPIMKAPQIEFRLRNLFD